MFKLTGVGLISATLLLAGCGGGGGGGSSSGLTYDGPTAAVVLSDETTADGIASTVVGMESSGATTFIDATGVISLGVATSPQGGAGTVDTSKLGTTAKQLAQRAFNTSSGISNLLTGLTDSQVQQCDLYSGSRGSVTVSMTVSNVDQYNNWIPTSGDTFSLTANNCYDGFSHELANGTVTFILATISSLDPVTGDPAEFAANFTFSNFKVTNTTTGDYDWLQGGFTAGFSGDGQNTPFVFSVTGSSMVVENMTAGATQTVRLTNFSFVDTIGLDGSFSLDHDYTVACTQLGGSVTVRMNPAFTIYSGDDNPTVGAVVVSGANGASIKLSAVDNLTAQIEYDLGGNGSYGDEAIDPALKLVYWADL